MYMSWPLPECISSAEVSISSYEDDNRGLWLDHRAVCVKRIWNTDRCHACGAERIMAQLDGREAVEATDMA